MSPVQTKRESNPFNLYISWDLPLSEVSGVVRNRKLDNGPCSVYFNNHKINRLSLKEDIEFSAAGELGQLSLLIGAYNGMPAIISWFDANIYEVEEMLNNSEYPRIMEGVLAWELSADTIISIHKISGNGDGEAISFLQVVNKNLWSTYEQICTAHG